MEQINLPIRTLFVEFQEAVLSRRRIEVDHYEAGTYTKKIVKGKSYWYAQRYVNGQAVQKYFGPSNTKNDAAITQKREDHKKQQKLLKQLVETEIKLAALLRRAGIPSLDSKTAAVIEALNVSNSVLVGSHAFAAYCGMLGVLFEHNLLKTADVDIAFDNTVEISGCPINILDVLKRIDPDFREIPGMSHKYPPHSFIGPSGIRVDIVAPLVGKAKLSIKVKNITGAAAEPLRFLDLLITDPVQAVLIGPKGGTPVIVPDPVRYALHKLIVSAYRPANQTSKKAKDLAQAHQLIEVCARERTSDLIVVYKDAIKRGPKWKKIIQQNLPATAKMILK